MQHLLQYYNQIRSDFPYLTPENFYRILLLFFGINFENQTSFPDAFTHFEIILTVPRLSSLPILTLLNPESPFRLLANGNGKHTLLYKNQYVDEIHDYEQRLFNFEKHTEPFYFYVTEMNGDHVLKLNPVQLCDFFQNSKGQQPCSFCFRNDMVQRFKNITAEELVAKILQEEQARDNLKTLKSIDEISIVTGSYKNDDDYVNEIETLVKGLKPLIRNDLRVVVGSHEGKGEDTYKRLQRAGVTVFAFPVETLDDRVRLRDMKNRKGEISIDSIIDDIEVATGIFGPDGIIVRLVAGMGDSLDMYFREKVQKIANFAGMSVYWNINQYMPFTHYHWRIFQQRPPYDLHYMFDFMNIINQYVPRERQMMFKVSP